MTTPGPKTGEEARALAEITNILMGGIFIGSSPINGDDIAFFTDSDGVTKTVRCIRRSKDGPDEWVKVPVGHLAYYD